MAQADVFFEDIDVGMMNENEVEELMLNIYVHLRFQGFC